VHRGLEFLHYRHDWESESCGYPSRLGERASEIERVASRPSRPTRHLDQLLRSGHGISWILCGQVGWKPDLPKPGDPSGIRLGDGLPLFSKSGGLPDRSDLDSHLRAACDRGNLTPGCRSRAKPRASAWITLSIGVINGKQTSPTDSDATWSGTYDLG
jgi:hypothetical protein